MDPYIFPIYRNAIGQMDFSAVAGLVTSKVGKRYAFTGFEALRELFVSK